MNEDWILKISGYHQIIQILTKILGLISLQIREAIILRKQGIQTNKMKPLIFLILFLLPLTSFAQWGDVANEQVEDVWVNIDGDQFYGLISGATSEILAASITLPVTGMFQLPVWAAKPTTIATAGRVVYVTDTSPLIAGIYYQSATEWIRIGNSNTIGTTIASHSIVDEQLSGAINGSNTTYQTGSEFVWDTISVSIRIHPNFEHIRLLRGTDYIQSGSDMIQMVTAATSIDPYNLESIDVRLYASYVTP